MERETKEIVTPKSQDKVVLKTWLTGRERRNIRAVFLNDVEFSLDDLEAEQDENAKPKRSSTNFKGDLVERANDEAIKNVVVSVNGDESNVLDAILDMRDEDYDFVMKEINALRNEQEDESLKKK